MDVGYELKEWSFQALFFKNVRLGWVIIEKNADMNRREEVWKGSYNKDNIRPFSPLINLS